MESTLLLPCIRYVLRVKRSLRITPCVELLVDLADQMGVLSHHSNC